MELNQKTKNDLEFIKKFQQFCTDRNWRVVLYGGYGLDAAIGKLTRLHGDIDLVVYGQDAHEHAEKFIYEFLNKNSETAKIETKPNPFQYEINVHDKSFVLNLYYIRTLNNPFNDLNSVIKTNGDNVVNKLEEFPSPIEGNLEGVDFEVQDQSDHLKDILAKGGPNKPKYVNDIKLINSLPARV